MEHYLATDGYLALFPLAIIEGPLVTVFAAFLVARGVLEFGIVYPVVVAADLVGDLIYYGIGRGMLGGLFRARADIWGARPWVAALRRRVGTLGPRIRADAGKMLVFGKLTHSAGFAILLAAGAAKVPLRTFLAYNLVATLLKSAVLIAVGYWLGQFYATVRADMRLAALVMFLVVGTAVLVLVRRMAGDGVAGEP